MVRSALPCLALGFGLALTACGKSAPPTLPKVSIPGPTSWDGTPPSDGSVLLVSAMPGNASQFVAYEVSTTSCAVTRTIVSDLDSLKGLIVTPLTDPKGGAVFAIIRTPPPPPPNGEDLLAAAVRATRDPRDMTPLSCKPQKPPGK